MVNIFSLFSKPDADPDKLTLGNGMEFMRVPAGEFLMGSKEGEAADRYEMPQHTVNIPHTYWMARLLVTNEQYDVYARARGIKHPVTNWDKIKKHPVVNVSWNDAAAYSKWLNDDFKTKLPANSVLRLPTEAEWEKAARGENGNIWPWGNSFDKNICNLGASGIKTTTSVGLHSPRGDSVYGCADMVGNVWEWTHSLAREYPYKADDGREEKTGTARRVLRGDSFIEVAGVRGHCASRADAAIYSFFNVHGFRVVASQELS